MSFEAGCENSSLAVLRKVNWSKIAYHSGTNMYTCPLGELDCAAEIFPGIYENMSGDGY